MGRGAGPGVVGVGGRSRNRGAESRLASGFADASRIQPASGSQQSESYNEHLAQHHLLDIITVVKRRPDSQVVEAQQLTGLNNCACPQWRKPEWLNMHDCANCSRSTDPIKTSLTDCKPGTCAASIVPGRLHDCANCRSR